MNESRLELARLRAGNKSNSISKNINKTSKNFLKSKLKDRKIVKSMEPKINVKQLLHERNAKYKSRFIDREMVKEKRLFLR